MTEPEDRPRKLALSKETLRGLDRDALADGELKRAHGGASTTGCLAAGTLQDCIYFSMWCLSEPC